MTLYLKEQNMAQPELIPKLSAPRVIEGTPN